MGNSNSSEDVATEIVKKIGSTALAISYFTPAAIVTGPATAVIAGGGLITEGIGHLTDNDDCKEVGGFFRGLGIDAAIDGVAGGALEGVKMSKGVAEFAKAGCEGFSRMSDDCNRAAGQFFIPTPPPRETLFVIKNIKHLI
ncbi:7330_t:CDS:1 [Paraglomus brasilianum]|uniref:7330_t:CDS:1 n=1 Tax=Paraglomus brasilianum TaxID=144538 RepID=A0A9N9C086_9GLOM|nr:7330_t:CDS:1 [Paraglomus brasilianum]